MASSRRQIRRNPGLHPAFPNFVNTNFDSTIVEDSEVTVHMIELYRDAGLHSATDEKEDEAKFEDPDLFSQSYIEIQLGHELGLETEEEKYEIEYTLETGEKEDLSFSISRAKRFEKGFKLFLAEISQGEI
jgi:hypothetical protein